MIKYTTKNEIKYVAAMEAIKRTFGDGEFTRAQYKKIYNKETMSGLDCMYAHGLKKVREEHFTVHLDEPYTKHVLKTDSGKVIQDISCDVYHWTSREIRKFLNDTLNDGNPLHETKIEVNEVEGVRYFYVFDEAQYKKELRKIAGRNGDTIKKLKQDCEKINKRLAVCEEIARIIRG